jgi:hypothetical protein
MGRGVRRGNFSRMGELAKFGEGAVGASMRGMN